MNNLRSVRKNPFIWLGIIAIAIIIYFFAGFIVKTVVSLLILCGAYWISKFTGPYMKKRALRNTIDDMVTKRTNWDGTLKSANQMYEINKVLGYIMPYLFAVILIFSIWTAKPDKVEKNTPETIDSNEVIEPSDETYELSNEVIEPSDETYELSNEEVPFNGEENDQEISSQNFVEGFPTPGYIYTRLLNPETRDQDGFFASLLANEFTYVELMEYSKDSIGSIYYEPGTTQDIVFINIYEYDQRERYTYILNSFFSDIPNINVDYSGDGGIVVSYQH